MSALGIRVRLTAVFALATVVMLAGAAWFVYERLRDDLDEGVTAALAARLAGSDPVGGDPEETVAQVLDGAGRVRSPAGAQPALTAAEAARAATGERVLVERAVPGVEGTTRLLARGDSERVLVAGQSLDDRDETLGQLLSAFAVGGPLAVLGASLLGYLLAAAALSPVEAMRRRAEAVSPAAPGERLPLPNARDEIRRLGETLNAMLDRLQRGYERERRFVADASHELRTPITVIKTELEGALRTDEVGPRAREALVAAVEEGDHLAALAEDLLVLARAGEGGMPLRREPLDARSLLEDVRVRFSARAAARGRALVVEGDARVWADRQRLRQALGNLVDNALRHGAGAVTLGARPADEGALLWVRDEGAGVRDPALFERFATGDAARSRSAAGAGGAGAPAGRGGGGTGLGLAIVRAIAEAHGGGAELDGGAVVLRLPSQGGLSGPA